LELSVNEKIIMMEYNKGLVSYNEAYNKLSDMGYSDNDIGDIMRDSRSVDYSTIKRHRPDPRNNRWYGTSPVPPGGAVWAYKTPWWFSEKEYRYDSMNVLDNPQAQVAFKSLESNMLRYDFLSKELAEAERKYDSVIDDILNSASDISTYAYRDLISDRNRLQKDKEELTSQIEDIRIDIDKDRSILHRHRDEVAKEMVTVGPLTTENRMAVGMVAAGIVGAYGAVALWDFLSQFDNLSFDGSRQLPVQAVFRTA
tara:strand:+ start:2460 stop:3224 length:765 start_codon:yes stop_codon:yes gene_type:complete